MSNQITETATGQFARPVQLLAEITVSDFLEVERKFAPSFFVMAITFSEADPDTHSLLPYSHPKLHATPIWGFRDRHTQLRGRSSFASMSQTWFRNLPETDVSTRYNGRFSKYLKTRWESILCVPSTYVHILGTPLLALEGEVWGVCCVWFTYSP